MPALFALAMHQALVARQPELRPEERSLAFLDDLYLTAQPDRIQPLFQAASRCLYERARISLNHAKTRVWNAAAVEPPGGHQYSRCVAWQRSAPRGRARDYRSRSPFWAEMHSCGPSSTQCATNNFASCRPFLTCRSFGCCCCTARRHGPTMHFVSYPQNSPIFLPLSTTLRCRDVSVQCCLEGRGGAPGHGQSAVPTCLPPWWTREPFAVSRAGHDQVLQLLPELDDLQASWLLLLFC